jgi:hypothetical protein
MSSAAATTDSFSASVLTCFNVISADGLTASALTVTTARPRDTLESEAVTALSLLVSGTATIPYLLTSGLALINQLNTPGSVTSAQGGISAHADVLAGGSFVRPSIGVPARYVLAVHTVPVTLSVDMLLQSFLSVTVEKGVMDRVGFEMDFMFVSEPAGSGVIDKVGIELMGTYVWETASIGNIARAHCKFTMHYMNSNVFPQLVCANVGSSGMVNTAIFVGTGYFDVNRVLSLKCRGSSGQIRLLYAFAQGVATR